MDLPCACGAYSRAVRIRDIATKRDQSGGTASPTQIEASGDEQQREPHKGRADERRKAGERDDHADAKQDDRRKDRPLASGR